MALCLLTCTIGMFGDCVIHYVLVTAPPLLCYRVDGGKYNVMGCFNQYVTMATMSLIWGPAHLLWEEWSGLLCVQDSFHWNVWCIAMLCSWLRNNPSHRGAVCTRHESASAMWYLLHALQVPRVLLEQLALLHQRHEKLRHVIYYDVLQYSYRQC